MTVQTGRASKHSSIQADPIVSTYRKDGYALIRNVVPWHVVDELLVNYLALVNRESGRTFTNAHGADLVAYFNEHGDVESAVYTKIRETPWLLDFARHPAIVTQVKSILGEDCGVFAKAPFRIDMPLWTKELALWHQDHFYVRGNTEILTAWIPFQDTTYFNGCLSVMPGSHTLGPVAHDVALGKKSVPSSIFGREIRMVEMNKGDLLLFNALTLHTGNLNLSQSIRYSLQPRYTPLGSPVDRAMGEVIPL
jgi:ectoine hydroxylase-related dioxygenase (phytanoyl-CoA dioxygenase family)